jgi:signal transduction histidine kinase
LRSLYLRIWLTVVAVLAAFALVSGWLVQRHLEQERVRLEGSQSERVAAWAELVQRSLPEADAPVAEQAAALRDWSQRLRLPMALDDARGQRIVTSDAYARREADMGRRGFAVKLDDGRTLWVIRPGLRGLRAPDGPPPRDPGMGSPPREVAFGPGPRDAEMARPPRPGPATAGTPWLLLPPGSPGWGLVLLLAVLFVAVALGAYPVVRRLTRRLESLKRGVETFGGGALAHRVDATGRDEVAALAGSFNRAAERIESLVRSHQSLLANASHELRSPLTRLKMAVSMVEQAEPTQRAALRREIEVNIAELDALVDEVLLASRLDAGAIGERRESVDLLAVAAEESARVDAVAQGRSCVVQGDEKLLRRALRNLLENARRYGAGDVEVTVDRHALGEVEVRVCDRGPGIPEAFRERIFEPFFRLPGHAEREGGVGLGLSLVRQIAQRHGGQVRCEARAGGGSCFVITLPG